MPLVDEVIVKSCGNDAHLIGLDNGRKIIKAMGYTLVQ